MRLMFGINWNAKQEVYPCPVDDTNTKKDNWMKSEEGRKRAVAEVENIIRCVRNGAFPDFEI